MKYGFYNKLDPQKEIIHKAAYRSISQAEKDFAHKKDMHIDAFLRLYEVVQIQ